MIITTFFKAHAEDLFRAWTDPILMKQWLFKLGNSEIATVEVSLEVGGQFKVVERTPSEIIDYFGSYVRIDKPKQLSFTLNAPKRFPGQTLVSVQFRQGMEECEMTFEQANVESEMVDAEWRRMFSQLAMALLKH